MGSNFELIKELVKIGFEPGDILLVKSEMKLSVRQWETIKGNLLKVLTLAGREYVPIALLEGGLDLRVLHIPPKPKEVNDHDTNERGAPKDYEKD